MAQNNAMASKSVLATLTDNAKHKLLAYCDEYEVTPSGANSSVVVFPLLYKNIMRLATLDTSATYAALRNNIMKVAEYAKKVNGNVDQINAFVDLNYTQLKARGDTVPDASMAIMKAYIAFSDVKFSEYFSKKLDDYWDETPEMHNISVESLLKKAKSKFDLIRSQDEWGALSQEAQGIIALKSKVEEMSSINLRLAKKLKYKAGGNQPVNVNPNAKRKK